MTHRLLARDAAREPLVPTKLETLEEHHQTGSLVWLDVTTSEPAELDALGERFGFDPAAIEDILDVEQLPKFDDYGDHLFVVLHALTADGDRVDTIELDCFIAPRLLVTVHATEVAGIDWLWDAVQRHPHLVDHGADELFAQLAEVVGRRYFEIVNAIEERIDAVALLALEADNRVLEEIQILRREESTVRKMMRPQLRLIADMRMRNRTVISSRGVGQLDDAFDVHNQVVESLHATHELLSDALDTYRGAAAERQANATTILAVYSALLLPLTLIVGWYGMNVDNLPASTRSWGWMAVTGFMVLLAVISWFVFVRIGLVRPSARRRGDVAKGLASAARRPVRAMTMLRQSRDTPDDRGRDRPPTPTSNP